jgi:hypothetical protein
MALILMDQVNWPKSFPTVIVSEIKNRRASIRDTVHGRVRQAPSASLSRRAERNLISVSSWNLVQCGKVDQLPVDEI